MQEAYIVANHSGELKVLDEMDEALALLNAAATIAIGEVRTHSGLGHAEFEYWLAGQR